jgi:hypothetical protein
MPRWLARWPHWSHSDIADLRDQFNGLDLNHDGMIDLEELSSALDRLGMRECEPGEAAADRAAPSRRSGHRRHNHRRAAQAAV